MTTRLLAVLCAAALAAVAARAQRLELVPQSMVPSAPASVGRAPSSLERAGRPAAKTPRDAFERVTGRAK